MNGLREDLLALPGYVPGEQPRGGEAVKLNTNENPYRASEKVYDAIREVARYGLSRYPNAMSQPFREAAAAVYGVEPEMILCGNGSDDLLTILTRSFLHEGDWLRLARPSYILYKTLALLQGGHAQEVDFLSDWTLPDSFGLPMSDGKALKLVYLPNPNSPSGTVISKERILSFAETLPCPLVIDEAYGDFAEENCIDLVRRNPKIIVMRTMSKSYALAGLRFGFLFADPAIVEQLSKMKDSYNCDSLAIAAATAAVQDQEWRQENRRRILATRECLTRRMRALGFTVPDSHANFTWNVHPDSNVSHRAIYEYLKERGWLIRYMDYGSYGDGLRITVGTDEQNDAMLDCLEGYFQR